MNDRLDVAIVGAGITGIACARKLVQAGLRVRLFDKGRGIGGRLATRRGPDGLRFDHGAPSLRPRDPAFAQQLSAARPWRDQGVVGCPGMSALPRALAQGLDVVQGVLVTGLASDGGGWRLRVDDRDHHAARVVLALPAPQAADLLGRDHAFAPALGQVRFRAVVTLMAGLDRAAPRPFATCPGHGALAWISQDGDKPERDDGPLIPWVAHAHPDWSLAHIDLPFERLAQDLAPDLLTAIGATQAQLRHLQAHRWLYAQADRPLGQPFLAQGGLVVGGDWALGPDAEDGWTSGRAMAAHLLSQG